MLRFDARLVALSLMLSLVAGCGAVGAATFVVDALEVGSGQGDIQTGDRVTLVAMVQNTGGQAGTYEAELNVNGIVRGLQTVELTAGETRMLTFVVDAHRAGHYEVALGDLRTSYDVSDPTAATFAFSDLRVGSGAGDVGAGEQVTVTARVQNTGEVQGTYRPELTVDGVVQSTQDVTLDAGESRVVEFVIYAGHPGFHQVRLGSASAGYLVAAAPATPEPATPPPAAAASFSASDLTITPASCDEGDDVSILVTISNSGDVAGTHAVNLLVDGTVDQTKQVTLAGGQSKVVSFVIEAGSAGRHAISVDDLEAQLAVAAYEQPVYERPASGTVLINKIRGGLGRLTIENGNDRDALVVVAKASNPSRPVLAVYIREGKSKTIRKVKNGTYTFYYSLGDGWDSAANAFTTDVAYRQFDGSLQFRTTRTSRGYRYTIWEVTLHTVPGGGTPVITVDEDDFPSLP